MNEWTEHEGCLGKGLSAREIPVVFGSFMPRTCSDASPIRFRWLFGLFSHWTKTNRVSAASLLSEGWRREPVPWTTQQGARPMISGRGGEDYHNDGIPWFNHHRRIIGEKFEFMKLWDFDNIHLGVFFHSSSSAPFLSFSPSSFIPSLSS